jgi:hypothetical protein
MYIVKRVPVLSNHSLSVVFYGDCCTDFHTLYGYTSCIWPSFVYHSRLTICDCLRFTKVCFCPYTSEKQFCLNDIARCLGSNIGRIAGRLGLMLCSRSLLRTVLELVGRNPGMLLAVRFDVWNRFRVYRRVGERYADACVI